MEKLTRRKLIIGATAGAATVSVLTAVPLKMMEQHPSATATTTSTDPLMVYVTNPSTGQLTLLVDDKEITFHDPDLVARLVRAAKH